MLIYISNNKLYVSQPNPAWFGNPKNKDPQFCRIQRQNNKDFRLLRVMNDDLVQPKHGFGKRPHSNMEIISYIDDDGELTHVDSIGNKETLGRGSTQYMSAGTGVHHQELNQSKNNPYNIILKFNIKVTKEKLENQIIMVHKILKHQLKSIKMQITLQMNLQLNKLLKQKQNVRLIYYAQKVDQKEIINQHVVIQLQIKQIEHFLTKIYGNQDYKI